MNTPISYPVTIELREIDMTRRTSITTLIGIILDIAGKDASENGFGVDAINQDNHTWVLSRFAAEVTRLPRVNDKLSITTWIGEYRRLLSTRNFNISSIDGEQVGGAISQWCMLDIKSRRAVDLSTLHQNYNDYVLTDIKPTIAPLKRIPSAEAACSIQRRVAYSDIDFNEHLNSLRYIDFTLDMLPIEILKQDSPLRIDIQFSHECYLGDLLTINYEQRGKCALFEILREGDISAFKCSIEWL